MASLNVMVAEADRRFYTEGVGARWGSAPVAWSTREQAEAAAVAASRDPDAGWLVKVVDCSIAWRGTVVSIAFRGELQTFFTCLQGPSEYEQESRAIAAAREGGES